MEKKLPLILISNDDGYHSPGIRLLADIACSVGDVLVCAPESARSGYACAFSAADFLRLKHRRNIGDAEVWSCSGTPVDCVKIALDQLCNGRRPDLILSGINHGDNSSVNNHYSGTMGVVREGCMKGIPSVAFSSCYYEEDANLQPLRPYIRKIIEKVLAEGLPKGICLNVNFPAAQSFKGIKACRMTKGRWVNEIVKEQHPRGYDYYWVVGAYANDEPGAEGTDQWALEQGYVAVTPTNIDVTHYDYVEALNRQLEAGELQVDAAD